MDAPPVAFADRNAVEFAILCRWPLCSSLKPTTLPAPPRVQHIHQVSLLRDGHWLTAARRHLVCECERVVQNPKHGNISTAGIGGEEQPTISAEHK